MAKIPTLGGTPQVSLNVPRTPTQSPGAASQVTDALTTAASSTLKAYDTYLESQRRAEESAAFNSSTSEFQKNVGDIRRNAEKDFSGSSYDGYSQRILDQSQEQIDRLSDQAPERIRDKVRQNLMNKKNSLENTIKNRELLLKNGYWKGKLNSSVDELADSSYNRWDPVAANEGKIRYENSIATSGLHGDNELQAAVQKSAQIPEAMIEGVIARGTRGELLQAKEDIQSGDFDGLFNSISPKKRRSLERMLDSQISAKEREEKSKLGSQARDIMVGISNGGINPANPQDKAIINNFKNRAAVAGMSEEVERLTVAERVSDVMRGSRYDVMSLNPDKISEDISEEISDPALKGRLKGEIAKQAKSHKQGMLQELRKDPASYVVNGDESLRDLSLSMITGDSDFREYKAAVDTRYDQLGVASVNRKYLPQQVRNHYSNSIKGALESKDHRAAAKVIEDFEGAAGRDAYRLYDELDIDKRYGVIVEADPLDRSRLLKNMTTEGRKQLNDIYKTAEEKVLDDTEVMRQLRQNPLYTAFSQSATTANVDNAEALMSNAFNEYKEAIISGADHDDAIDNAYKTFEKNYEVIEENGQFIPVKKGVNPDKIRNFLEVNQGNIDWRNKFNISKMAFDGSGEVLKDPSTDDKFNTFYKNTARWVYDPKNEGLTLRSWDGSKFSQANTLKKNEAGDVISEPIVVKFKDIEMMDFDTDNDSKRKKLELLSRTRFGI